MDESQRKSSSVTRIQITALDAIVNVNSLYTLAVFLGLAWNPYDPNNTLIKDTQCYPTREIAENLVSFHVYSFISFLFSSLLALSLKLSMRLSKISPSPRGDNHDHHDGFRHFATHLREIRHHVVNKTALQFVLLATAVGSVSGCVFLMLALVSVVQVKLGRLACGSSSYSYGAVIPLLIFVPAGLLIYTGLVLYALTR